MSIAMLTKMHINGYDVLSVNHGPWRVCTKGDRLGAFASREEALAFAACCRLTRHGQSDRRAASSHICT